MTRLRSLLPLALILAAGCGGGDGGSAPEPYRAVTLSDDNPTTGLPNQAVPLLVLAQPVGTSEIAQVATVTASAEGGELSETSWTQVLNNPDEPSYKIVYLHVPGGAKVGDLIRVRVERTVAGVSTQDTAAIRVTGNGIQSAISRTPVSGKPGDTVDALIYMKAVNADAGRVRFSTPTRGATINPTVIDLKPLPTGGETEVQVKYRIPIFATAGSTIDVPVTFRSEKGGNGAALLKVQVTN